MRAAVEFFTKWIDLITVVFKRYPLAAALVTLLELIVFGLNVNRASEPPFVLAALALLFWAVSVPIVGSFMNGLSWFYRHYAEHPIFMILSTLAFVALFSILQYFDIPARGSMSITIPNFISRIVIIIIGYAVFVAMLVPILDLFSRKEKVKAD